MRIDHDTRDALPDESLFNLSIRDMLTQRVETARNVSLDPDHVRYVGRVLEQTSSLARLESVTAPAEGDPLRPSPTPEFGPEPAFSGGSDGNDLTASQFDGNSDTQEGIYALEKADLFNMLCIPPLTRESDVASTTWNAALAYCKSRRAMLIVDPPQSWTRVSDVPRGIGTLVARDQNATIFFPHLLMPDPLKENRLEPFAPSGVVAGVISRTDTERGVWKAPADIDATLRGVAATSIKLTDADSGRLNPLGINCLRTFPVAGTVVWGARTLRGADQLASEWKYLSVRRLALNMEESLYRGTQWVVFEPNDESLWGQIRLNVGAYMQNLFRQGAFQGQSPREAYFVKCDSETTTQDDINRGIVNIVVGFAPLQPAEFVIISLQQIAGEI